MKYLLIGAVAFILSATVFAMPIERENILIVELQTGSSESASEEFIELHNPNDVAIDLSGWILQKKSATGADWTTKAELSSTIEPRGRYLISSDEEYLAEEQMDSFSSPGLAGSGGHVRLLEPAPSDEEEEIIHDTLGWGAAADSAEGDLPATAPDGGESLKRFVDEDGYFIDTDINFDDFEISDTPTPVSDDELNEEDLDNGQEGGETVPGDENDDGTDGENDEEEEEVSDEEQTGEVLGFQEELKIYPKVKITELFIDPGSPKTDADDEFIELFNPNKESVELEGYVIKTGNTYSRSFTIPKLSIKPGQYLALYSMDTGLPLSNSGSQAKILDPNGDEVFKTDPYEKAKTDISWALVGGKWQWTAQPTPAAPNRVVVPASSSRKKSSRSSSSRSSSSKSSKSSPSDDGRIIYEEPAAIVDSEINIGVLIGVGSLAIGYAMYEYRHDISNRIYQFRRYLKSRG